MIEIDVLQHLAKNDKDDSHCVKMHSWFDYRNHICIVFEKLGPSLFDFLKRNKYSPFPVDLVREFGRQLLESVACLWIVLGLALSSYSVFIWFPNLFPRSLLAFYMCPGTQLYSYLVPYLTFCNSQYIRQICMIYG